MESKAEEMKVVHSQHVRILKEDDEIWISSEDLNTENSSDDDKTKTKNAYKKKLKLKTRKRSTPNIKLQRPSIPSVSSTSKDLDDRLLMPSPVDDVNRSTDDSRTSDEEYHHPPVPSECLSKRLSLEDWRPMKGALSSTSTLEENASATGETTKVAHRDSKNFFDAMLYKLKSLKHCPSSEERLVEAKEKTPRNDTEVDKKSFGYLKNTPQVRQQLDFIKKLNKGIEETLSLYKKERAQRLNLELELYKNVSGTNLLNAEGDTALFLEMCERDLEKFKMPETKYAKESKESERDADEESKEISAVEINKENNLISATNFIKKNIYAAREGTMANLPLTDEDKIKIAELLKDIDNYELDDAELSLSTTSITENDDEQPDIDNDVNCFALLEDEENRISEIDSELEKFTLETQEKPNQKGTLLPVKDEKFWNLALEQHLKDIDAKLEKLHDLDHDESIIDSQFHKDCQANLKRLKEEFPDIEISVSNIVDC